MTQSNYFPESLRKVAKPVHKNVWALPAAINFFLGGTAAGYYILWVLSMNSSAAQIPGAASVGLLAVSLISAGFAALALEAGRPLRARYLVSHWKRSWMSREAAAGIIFILAAIIDAITASSIAEALALGAACAFLLSQGMMVFRCTAVPVWRDPVIPLLFISSGLAAGYALILFNRYGLILQQFSIAPYADAIAFVCLIINFAAWSALLVRRRDAAMQMVVRRLLRPEKIAMVIGIGQVLPAILLLIVRPWSLDATGAAPLALVVVAAPAILIGNFAQKLLLVRCVQQLCGMQLDGEKWK